MASANDLPGEGHPVRISSEPGVSLGQGRPKPSPVDDERDLAKRPLPKGADPDAEAVHFPSQRGQPMINSGGVAKIIVRTHSPETLIALVMMLTGGSARPETVLAHIERIKMEAS